MALPEVELTPLPTRTSAITQEATIGVQAMIRPQVPVHMGQTLGVLQRGAADAAYRITAREPGAEMVWVTARTPQLILPVTLRFSRAADNTPEPALPALHRLLMRPILVQAWARLSPEMLLEEPQARADVEALVRSCPTWLGLGDSWESFTASAGYASLPRSLRRAHQEHPGLRLSASDQLDRHVFAAIIEQRVTLKEAFQTQRDVLIRYGEPAVESGYRDQPAGMRVHPTARTLGTIPDWGWHRVGVDAARYNAVRAYARAADSLHRLAAAGPVAHFASALGSLHGVGPWTVTQVLQIQVGHPDAVSVGDYHLAHHVGYALRGKRGDDADMLRLLAPYAGHRQRVVRLILAAGATEPRRGPRTPVQDYRDL